MYTITVFFAASSHEPVVLHGVGAGSTLLEICLANNIALPHDCGGVCACTTCRISIEKGEQHLSPKSKREADFLQRKVGGDENLRLACQSLLLAGSGQLTLLVQKTEGSRTGR